MLLNFTYQQSELLSIVDEAINYTVEITNNLLYITNLNSPYRILVEAQVSVYNQFLLRLAEVDRELTLMFLEIMGIVPRSSRAARVTLTFTLSAFSDDTVYFKRGFPVRATNGIIFLTDQLLSIPSGARTGSVVAVALTDGSDGNLPIGAINQPLQVLTTSFTVTNETRAELGGDGESLMTAQLRLGELIRKSGLITEIDYINFVRERFLSAVVSVSSLLPNSVDVFVAYEDGSPFTNASLTSLNNDLQQYRILGLDSLQTRRLEIINVYVEVVGSIRQVSDSRNIANDINNILRNYLRPNNDRQADENTKGIIILNEIERQIGESMIDFVQGVRIGISEQAAYGQNFIFNPVTQRVLLSQLKVILIQNTTNLEYVYNS